MNQRNSGVSSEKTTNWDHTTHESFYDYYAEQSLSAKTLERFLSVQRLLLRWLSKSGEIRTLKVADVGCGAGAQCQIWAEKGHTVYGLDINKPLIELGLERAQEKGLDITLSVGSATNLPWPDQSMDVCLAPELLEHVADWTTCLDEFSRILKPGGVLYVSTSNKLCPLQDEFNLPLYSWYPAPLKRYVERLAITTRPDLANHAKYPAVNWFSFFQLQQELKSRGLSAIDRFDAMNPEEKSPIARAVLKVIRALTPVRWLAHVATPYTVLLAFKR